MNRTQTNATLVLSALLSIALVAAAPAAATTSPSPADHVDADDQIPVDGVCVIITTEPNVYTTCGATPAQGPCVIVSTNPPNAGVYTHCSGSGASPQ